MEQIKDLKYNEDERVWEITLSMREPSIKKKYEKLKNDSSQYLKPFIYGLRIGLLFGFFLGGGYGLYKTIRTKNPYYIPISAIVYSGVTGVANSLFYLIRS